MQDPPPASSSPTFYMCSISGDRSDDPKANPFVACHMHTSCICDESVIRLNDTTITLRNIHLLQVFGKRVKVMFSETKECEYQALELKIK